MRKLSATLLAAQKGAGVTGAAYEALWKIVLSRSGQTTSGYDRSRVKQIQHTEQDDNGISEVLLQNSDLALNDINFEQYQGIISTGYHTGVTRSAWVADTEYAVDDVVIPTTANGYQYRCVTAGTSHASTEPTWGTALGVQQDDGTVTWEMDGYDGDEYSPTAPLKVDSQEFISSETKLVCRLYLIGIPNQLRQDKAESAMVLASDDTETVKDLLTDVGDTSLTDGTNTPYSNYSAVTVTYDTGYDDGIIDDFIPADYFSVGVNENRDNKIKELLNLTGCKRRTEYDGAIHILQPTTTGETYDYEYRLAVATYHTFFNKALRNRFINPNKEVVKSHSSHSPAYSGSATSATSYALSPKIHTTIRRLTSNEQAADIAAAIIERYELDAERGLGVVPMNCGQEIWDYVKFTDGRQEDTRIGNVQYIQRNCKAPEIDGVGAFNMTIRFGRVNSQTIGALADEAYGAGIPQWIIDIINTQSDDILALFENWEMLVDFLNLGLIPGSVLLTSLSGDLDDIDDGSNYAKVLATDISAGHVLLTEVTGDLDDIDDGSNYAKVLATDISAGHVLLTEVTGDLDDITDGTSYGKLLLTDISSGHIKLTSSTAVVGEWYDESGVEIDATHGINIYGTANALTTRPTKTGTIQCYVGADGKIYAGAGAVILDSGGLTFKGNVIYFKNDAGTQRGLIYGGASYFNIYSGQNIVLDAGDTVMLEVPIEPTADGGEAIGQADKQFGYGYIKRTYADTLTKIPVGANMYQ